MSKREGKKEVGGGRDDALKRGKVERKVNVREQQMIKE